MPRTGPPMQRVACAGEELADGLLSIAAVVRADTHEVVAALGMDAHSTTIVLPELVAALGPHLISAADRVSARLGYRRADERASVGARFRTAISSPCPTTRKDSVVTNLTSL